MIYLLLSIFCGAMVSISMRLSEGKVKSKLCMIATNYLTCLTVAWGLMGFQNVFPAEEGIIETLGMGTFNGFFYMLALIMNQYNISRNGVVLSSVFSKMGGLLIPLLVSILIFREAPTMFQFIGFVLSVVSVIMLNYRKDGTGAGGSFKLSLFALLVAEGCAGIMSKVFNETGNSILASNFLFFTFGTAFLFCVIVILFKKERPGKNELMYGVMIGLPNFMGSRFVLKALESVPAVVVYPSRSVGTIVVITLVGMLIFKERLTKQQLVAMAVILAALILLNL